MKLTDALVVFGTKAAIADALSIRPQVVAKWRELVPENHRMTLVIASEGRLKAGDDDIKAWTQQRTRIAQALKLCT